MAHKAARPKRFRVALSFPGEHRDYVEKVAARLSRELGKQNVLYDRYHEAEFARTDLDTHLQRMYHDESELIVVFLCAEYERKEWCGVEWRALRDLIKRRQGETVMSFRFDDTAIPGLFSIDGYVWIGDWKPQGVADLILERLRINAVGTGSDPLDESRRHKPANLPYSSLGDLFRGREEPMEELRASLGRAAEGHATAIVGKALHGLGGVGKTRLAVEYAWRHQHEHSALLFVPADTPESLHRNLAGLTHPLILDLLQHEATEEEAREVAVIRWLRENPGWLLILDNADTLEAAAAVEALLRRLSGGEVLITSRISTWSPNVEAHELDVLGEEAAVEFLLARTGSRRRKTADDAAHARALAEELGCLALALEQAAAYIVHHRLSFPRYLGSRKDKAGKVLEWYDERVMSYPKSVAVTWQTSFDRLSDAARRLLQRLAWLAPDPVPESLLDTPAGDEDPAELGEALAELAAYSLVTRAADTPTFTVHRLVQEVTRRSQEGEGAPESLREALAWINAAFVGDPQDVRTWPTLDPLALHLQALVRHADGEGLSEPTARLMTQLGRLLMNKARLAEAEPLLRRALDIDEASFGPQHPDVAIDLNNLALLLQDTNRLAEAEPLMRRALDIDEAGLGPQHPDVAIDLNNLAQILKDTNRLAEAEPLMRRALDIDEASLGPRHPNVARDLNNLAALLQDTNRLAEAGPLLRRALDIDEASFGPQHPDVAIDLNNLAVLLQATDRLSEAEPLMRRALDIDEASFGSRHPNVARDLNNLAQLLWATNRLAEAEPLMRRALDIHEASFGTQHPYVAIDLNNLALLLQYTNRLAEAEPLLCRCLGILLDFEKRNGYEHPYLEVATQNYRDFLRSMGKTEQEIEAALEALPEAETPPSPPDRPGKPPS